MDCRIITIQTLFKQLLIYPELLSHNIYFSHSHTVIA